MPRRAEPDPYAAAIGRRLQVCRDQRRMTQRQVAKLLEMSDTHLSNVEHGLAVMKVDVAYKLAQFYGVSLDWLCDPSSNLNHATEPTHDLP